MSNEGDKTAEGGKKGFWNFIDNIQGDKVVWIIVFMLIMISALAIFSSTSTLTGADRDRVDLMKTHALFIAGGLCLIWLLYKIKSIRFFRRCSQFGFGLSLILLLMMFFKIEGCHGNVSGMGSGCLPQRPAGYGIRPETFHFQACKLSFNEISKSELSKIRL